MRTPCTAASRPVRRRATPPRPTLLVGDLDACRDEFARRMPTVVELLLREANLDERSAPASEGGLPASKQRIHPASNSHLPGLDALLFLTCYFPP